MSGLRVLVTGGAGYLGSRLVYELIAKGLPLGEIAQIDIVDRGDHGMEALLPLSDYWGPPQINIYKQDILLWKPDMDFGSKPDVIFHLAGVVGQPAVAKNPSSARLANVESWRYVRDLIEVPGNLVVWSSCSVYGSLTAGSRIRDRIDNTGWREDDTLPSCRTYDVEGSGYRDCSGWDKWKDTYASQKRLIDDEARELGATVLRPGTALGWSPRPRLDLLGNAMVFAQRQGRTLDLFAPDAKRPWATTERICNAARTLVGQGGIYNVISDNLTKHQLLDELTGSVSCRRVPSGDSRDYAADGTCLWRELPYDDCEIHQALCQLEEGIKLLDDSDSKKWRNV